MGRVIGDVLLRFAIWSLFVSPGLASNGGVSGHVGMWPHCYWSYVLFFFSSPPFCVLCISLG